MHHQETPVLLVQCPTVQFLHCQKDCSHIQPLSGLHPLEVSLLTKDLIRYHLFHSCCDPAAPSDVQKRGGLCPLVESGQYSCERCVPQWTIDRGLPPLEELVESITVLFMLHIKLVSTICSDVDF
jgi:hypothetical protein